MSDMVIRLRDEGGTEVTYEPASRLSKQLGTKSLPRWAKSGAVRTRKVRGTVYYAVLDAALLVALEPRETVARGIRRVPKDEAAIIQRCHDGYQGRTAATAKNAGQVWDDYDLVFVADAFNAGAKVELIAKTLGRTYDAVCNQIVKLRKNGSIPETGYGAAPPGWQYVIMDLLTDHEQSKFLKARLAATRAQAAEEAA